MGTTELGMPVKRGSDINFFCIGLLQMVSTHNTEGAIKKNGQRGRWRNSVQRPSICSLPTPRE